MCGVNVVRIYKDCLFSCMGSLILCNVAIKSAIDVKGISKIQIHVKKTRDFQIGFIHKTAALQYNIADLCIFNFPPIKFNRTTHYHTL